MPKKSSRNTKGKIVSAAWKLFYEEGYENTTVEDIIFASGTSKGSFYHYFDGKDSLLSSLSYLFDEKYEKLMEEMPPDMPATTALAFLNHELFLMIDNTVAIELMAQLLSSQLVTRGERHLLDRNRTYFKILRQVVTRGQERGEIRRDMTVNEVMKAYAMWERALLYDWSLSNGEYSLCGYADKVTPMFLESFLPKD